MESVSQSVQGGGGMPNQQSFQNSAPNPTSTNSNITTPQPQSGPPAMERSNSNLQFPSSAPPPQSNPVVSNPQPPKPTPFQQLYTDHYMQQQQQQQQQQLEQQQQQQNSVAATGTGKTQTDMDVNYAYWQQKQGAGARGHTLSTFPPDLMEKSQPKASKTAKDSSQARIHKGSGGKTGPKVGGQRDKVKKEKGAGESSGKSMQAGSVGKSGTSTGSATKKRKNANGEDGNAKKVAATNRAQKPSKNSLATNGKGGDAASLLSNQGIGMVKVSGAGNVVPTDATWLVITFAQLSFGIIFKLFRFPFPTTLDKAVNIFENKIFSWDEVFYSNVYYH